MVYNFPWYLDKQHNYLDNIGGGYLQTVNCRLADFYPMTANWLLNGLKGLEDSRWQHILRSLVALKGRLIYTKYIYIYIIICIYIYIYIFVSK